LWYTGKDIHSLLNTATLYLKFQVLWDVTPCQPVNISEVSNDRNVFVFKVQQSKM